MITDAIKALPDDLTLEIIGLPFGQDRQAQWFDQNTDIALEVGDAVPVYYWHGFGDRSAKSVPRIGRAIYEGVGELAGVVGHKFKATLDNAFEASLRIYEDAKKGLARASSDSASHFVRPFGITGKPGYVSSWPIFAMSLMDSSVAQTAVNPRAIAIAAAKAFCEHEVDIWTADEAQAGEATEATKAGAAIAKRNRDRIEAVRSAWKAQGAALDDLEAEYAAADGSEDDRPDKEPATKSSEEKIEMAEINDNITVESPAVNVEPKDSAVDVAAVKADLAKEFDAKLEAAVKALDQKVVEAGRKGFAVPNINKGGDEVAAKAYEEAWETYVRTGDASVLNTPAAKAVMNRTTAGQGGYLAPIKYSNELVTAMNAMSKLRQAGRVIQVEGSNSFKMASLTNSAAAVLKVESTAYDQQEPTIGEITFTPYKFTHLSLATDEILADSRLDVYGEVLLPDAVNAFAQAENSYFATGTGTSQPQGLTVGASVGVTAAATNAITVDEIIDLYHSLGSEYRDGAVWFMNDATLKVIRKFRENDTTGAFLWQPGLNGQPSTLLDKPIVTLSTIDTIATGKKVIAFGNAKRYFVIADFDSGNAGFKRLEERYAELGQVGFRWSKRVDSRVLNSAAIKTLLMA